MKSLLFALGLALCCFVQAEVTTVSEKELGRWMILAVACNSPEGLEQLKYLSAFAADLSRLGENVLSISALIYMPDGCKNVTYQLRKEEDGKYHGISDDTKVTVESVKAVGDIVMSTININNEYKASALHSRNVTQDPEVLQKFKDECKKLGYSKDQIVILNPNVKCL